jgi:hypothetical protein
MFTLKISTCVTFCVPVSSVAVGLSVDPCMYASGSSISRVWHGYSACNSVKQTFPIDIYIWLITPWDVMFSGHHTFLPNTSHFSSHSFIMILITRTTLAAFSWLGVASAQYYAITGVQDGVGTNGSRPARQNINTLQTNPYAWYDALSD